MSKTVDTGTGTSIVSNLTLSSKTIRAVLVLLSGVAIAAYWFRQPIADFFVSTWTTIYSAVIGALGLGLVPVVMWVGLLVWAVATRRIAVKHLVVISRVDRDRRLVRRVAHDVQTACVNVHLYARKQTAPRDHGG